MFPLKATNRRLRFVLAVVVMVCLVIGGLLGYAVSYYSTSEKIFDLKEQLADVQNQLSLTQQCIVDLQSNTQKLSTNDQNTNSTYQNAMIAIADLQSQLFTLQTELDKLQQQPNVANQSMAELQNQIFSIQNQLSVLQQQINQLQETQSISISTNPNVTYVAGENLSLSKLFEQVKESVVVVQGFIRQIDFFGRIYYSSVQGSGFLYDHAGRIIILTNNHVINGALNITVTFTTGDVYAANLLGANPDNDFAVLSINGSKSNCKPLEIVNSSMLKVGDPVIVVGTPYGLAGSMSNGIISALNRTLTTTTQSAITGVIQTTAPLNPGNSGGPVMNYQGQVVGIATAIVQESQGIGFAIPSDAILSDLMQILPA